MSVQPCPLTLLLPDTTSHDVIGLMPARDESVSSFS